MLTRGENLDIRSIKEHFESLSTFELLSILSKEQDWYYQDALVVIKYTLLERGVDIQKIKDADEEFRSKQPKRDLLKEMWADPEYRRYLWYILGFIIVAILTYSTKDYETDYVIDKVYP